MINAKDRFKEGFVMVMRPFHFSNLSNPIQKFTILWAHSEQPKIQKELTETAKEKVDEIENTSYIGRFFNQKDKEEFIEEEIERVFKNPSSWKENYKGEIVQAYIDGQILRLFPEEYKIISRDKLQEIMQEEGYHAVCTRGLFEIKEFRDKAHYLMSRGVSKHIANKWASVSFKELVYYKPYYELLNMFCRNYEIYADKFYEETEGVLMEDQVSKEEIRQPIFSDRLL